MKYKVCAYVFFGGNNNTIEKGHVCLCMTMMYSTHVQKCRQIPENKIKLIEIINIGKMAGGFTISTQ